MSDTDLPPFRKFIFGYDAAETEASLSPDLLTQGFVRLPGVIDELLSGHRFVVLGSKGSGKSAIREHLKFSENATQFVNVASLLKFPYDNLKDIVGPQHEERHFPSAWAWLLLVNFLQSFDKDQGGNAKQDEELSNTCGALKSMGFLPSAGLKELLLESTRKWRLRVEVPFGFKAEASHESQRDFHVPFFAEKLQSAVLRFRSEASHFLILDDLDSVLMEDKKQLHSLAALMGESLAINSSFQREGIRAKVILLLRTDLFDRLPGSDTNKIRQDYSIRLEWYRPDISQSPLWTVANQRARMMCQQEIDIGNDYFPAQLRGSERVRVLPVQAQPTRDYLLRHTRFTPRDFVMLLNNIKRHARQIRVEPNEVASGLRDYATEYFVPEIRNELSGYFEVDEITALFNALGRLGDMLFSIERLRKYMPSRLWAAVPTMLDVLFDCSAVGNWERERTPGVRTYRYNYPNSRLEHSEAMVLHPALGLAFNLATDSGVGRTGPGKPMLAPNVMSGVVTRVKRGFGFIKTTDGRTYFYSNADVKGRPAIRLCDGDSVSFEPAAGPQRGSCPAAKDVTFLGRGKRS
jgi:cold shock CspA family protein